MKHCRLALPFAALAWPPVAVSLALACSRHPGDATLLIDSTLLRGSLEVVAVPVDPLSLRPRVPVSARPTTRTDSLATAAALRDSADRLDATFQRERAALNDEARLLQSLPAAARRSTEYGRRYATFTARLEPAQRTRLQRDSIRTRAGRLHPAGSAAPALPADSAAHARLMSASDGDRRAVAARAAPVVHMRLSSGAWWIGVGAAGQHPERFSRVTLSGRGDTIRLPAP